MIVSGFLPAVSEEKAFIGQSEKAPSIFKVWKGLRASFWVFKISAAYGLVWSYIVGYVCKGFFFIYNSRRYK